MENQTHQQYVDELRGESPDGVSAIGTPAGHPFNYNNKQELNMKTPDQTTQIVLRIVEVANQNGYFVSSYTADYISFKYYENNDKLLDHNLDDKPFWEEIKKYVE